MLTAEVINRIRETISAQLAPRDRTFLEALQRDESFISGRGLLGSTAAANKYIQTASDELKVRAGIVLGSIVRAYSSIVGTYADTTLDDLVAQSAEHTHAVGTHVRDTTLERMKHHQRDDGTIRNEVDTLAKQLQRQHEIELQFFADQLRRPSAPQAPVSAPVITINGNVGALQTGAHSVANVVMGDETDRLASALEALRRAIEQSNDTTAEQRAQATEVVADAIVATKADKPNPPKLAGLLSGVATSVQTIASVRGAWELVRDAAVALRMLFLP